MAYSLVFMIIGFVYMRLFVKKGNRYLITFFLLLLCPVLVVAQNPVRYRDIPLGENIKTTTSLLKKQGFKVVKTQTKEEHLLYGAHPEVFLLGEQDGYPTVIHLEASAKSRTVFYMHVIFREFIDLDEAIEHADRLVADERVKAPSYKWEMNQRGVGLIDMPDRKGRITRYMTYPKVSVIYRFYSSKEQRNSDYLGCVTHTVWENSLGHEHLISLDYYDHKAARLAQREAGYYFEDAAE